ncbi:MAG: PucR family transcriptional regulator [Mycobacterium sp.]
MTGPEAAAAEKWLREFARAAESSDALDLLVKAIDDDIVGELPEFADPALRADLHASTRAHWKGFLPLITRESIEVRPAPQIHDLARTLARRGFELPLLLSVYRIGQRATWQYITGLLQTEVSDPALRSAVLLRFWTQAAYWIDSTVESLIVTFTAEREQWQRGALARRAAIVKSILAGQSVDLDASITALAYPLRQFHTAFTLLVDEKIPESEVQHLIEVAARTMAATLSGGQPLIVSSAARAAWCWTASPCGTEPAAAWQYDDLPRFVRATVGNTHRGLAGFRLSHSEAVAALAVAERIDADVVRFADVELACLAAGVVSHEGRSAFVRRELAHLAESDEATERIRETLQIYLRQGGDAAITGDLLSLHPNTVRYRVRQAEKKLGHPIQHRRVQIELALEIMNVLGIEH